MGLNEDAQLWRFAERESAWYIDWQTGANVKLLVSVTLRYSIERHNERTELRTRLCRSAEHIGASVGRCPSREWLARPASIA